MKRIKPLAVTVYDCRDCKRKIGWCKDNRDPKGARCFDCQVIHLQKLRGGKP